MDTAENTALTYQSEKPNKYFSYYNSKEMIEPGEPIPTAPPRDLEDAGGEKIFIQPKEIVLTPKVEFFETPVNMSVSSVHVPTNVYDRGLNFFVCLKRRKKFNLTFFFCKFLHLMPMLKAHIF